MQVTKESTVELFQVFVAARYAVASLKNISFSFIHLRSYFRFTAMKRTYLVLSRLGSISTLHSMLRYFPFLSHNGC